MFSGLETTRPHLFTVPGPNLTKNATHFLSFAKRRLRSAKREQEKVGCAPSRLGRHRGAQVNKYQERLDLSVEMKGYNCAFDVECSKMDNEWVEASKFGCSQTKSI